MKKLFLFATLAFISALRGEITGQVSADGKPVAGIAVSNGYAIVRTDKEGRYALADHPRQQFVFLCTPTGFRAKEKYYQEIETDGNHDFTLVKAPANSGKFIHISDTEFSASGSGEQWLKALKSCIQNNQAGFLLLTGDVTANKNAGLDYCAKEFGNGCAGARFYIANGNHDFTESVPSDEHFRKLFGPLWYSFDFDGVHYIVTPMPWANRGLMSKRKPAYEEDDWCNWLEKDLAMQPPKTPIALINHENLLVKAGFVEKLKLKQYNIIAMLSGHTHFTKKEDFYGIPAFSIANPNQGGVASPAAFAICKFDGKQLVRQVHLQGMRNTLNAFYANGKLYVQAFSQDGSILKVLADGREMEQLNEVSFALELPAKPESLIAVNARGEKRTVPLNPTTFSWVAQGGKGQFLYTQPLIAGNLLFAFESDEAENLHNAVIAFDKFTGKVKWRTPVKAQLKGRFSTAKGALAVCDLEENCYLLDCETGKIRWQKQLRDANQGERTVDINYIHGTACDGNLVFAGEDQTLSALRMEDGTAVWKNPPLYRDKSGKTNDGIGASHALMGDLLLVNSRMDFAWGALEPKTGKSRWFAGMGYNDVFALPLQLGNRLFLPLEGGTLAEVAPENGKILSRRKLDSRFHRLFLSSPALFGDSFVSGSARNGLEFYSIVNDGQKQQFRGSTAGWAPLPYLFAGQHTWMGIFQTDGKRLFTFDCAGNLYAFLPNAFTPCWKAATESPITSILLEDNRLYALHISGLVSCIEVP